MRRFRRLYIEILIQLVIALLLLLFVAFDKHSAHIHWHEIPFMANYVFASLIINYLLLPYFFYRKRYFMFAIYIIAVLSLIIIIEEFILEQLMFFDHRSEVFNPTGTLVEAIPILLILLAFNFARDAARKQRKIDELKHSMIESELDFLKGQINPHFMFNNLNNLYAYALESSPKTPKIILELSAIIRYMLYDCKDNKVLLEKEIDNIRSFVKLNELQFEGRGNISFNTKGSSNHKYIAPLILIVFVENAFKHSMSSQTEGILVDISLETNDNILQFKCVNSYTQQTNTRDIPGGIGLKNVITRLDMLYADGYKLSVDDTGTLYSVNLNIELNRLKE